MAYFVFFFSVTMDHGYSVTSPSVFKRKAIESADANLKARTDSYKKNKKIKTLKSQKEDLKKKLQEVLKKVEMDEETRDKLDKLTEGEELIGQLNNLRLEKGKKYPSHIRKFCLSLHFYSPKVINFESFL